MRWLSGRLRVGSETARTYYVSRVLASRQREKETDEVCHEPDEESFLTPGLRDFRLIKVILKNDNPPSKILPAEFSYIYGIIAYK